MASAPFRDNAPAIAGLLSQAPPAPRLDDAAERFCRAAPGRAEFWDQVAVRARREGDQPRHLACGVRGLLLDPGMGRRWLRRALDLYEARAGDPEPSLRRAAVIAPDAVDAQRSLAGLASERHEVDVYRPLALLNSLKRWLVLDRDPDRSGISPADLFRRLGDWRAFARVSDWIAATRACRGGGPFARMERAGFVEFETELAAISPQNIETDFPARTFDGRVLLHPRLPDAGPWLVRGPTDQVARALRVLRFANPEAVVLAEDVGSAPASARLLSLVPTDAPGAWFLPCLWGHWHVWWTVLPAILDARGQPDPARRLAFCIATRQFVTFWYAKGHERRYIAEHLDLGRSIAARLGDAASQRGYLETLSAHRPTYIRRFFTEVAHRLQYFDYAVYRPGDVILNLGVAEGFEIPAYLALIGPTGTLHNIDPEGYSALGASARTWIDGTATTVVLHECALSDVDGEIEMETGGCWEDTRISKRQFGEVRTLPSKRLDTFVAEQGLEKIDHIKLDIEGGEGFLLEQLIAVMNSHRPQIEISIYHTVEQFFEIPDRMMRETSGYRFFFHHYCGHFGEGTLYAVPEEIEPLPPIKP